MKDHSKEEAYDLVTKQLALCTIEDSVHSGVVLIVDNVKETVKVFGLNIDESELPILLVEAAGSVSEKFMDMLKNRTLN